MERISERCLSTSWKPSTVLHSSADIRGEGIVVKKAASQYVTNSRAADWVKVKPEYADQMGEVGMMRENAYARIWTYWFWEVGGEREGEQVKSPVCCAACVCPRKTMGQERRLC